MHRETNCFLQKIEVGANFRFLMVWRAVGPYEMGWVGGLESQNSRFLQKSLKVGRFFSSGSRDADSLSFHSLWSTAECYLL